MDIKTATQILKRHNKWRRGDENILPVGPRGLGVAIDTILEKLKNYSDLSHISDFSDKDLIQELEDRGHVMDFL